MDLNFYRFRSVWHVAAEPREAYAVLEDLDGYPAWWPEVKEAQRLDDSSYSMRVRSLLPYDLFFTTRRERQDPQAGILQARMTGDLDGFSRWTLERWGSGARLTFDEEVVANKQLLRTLALVARPAFKANHALMMHRGRRGLQTYLAGYRFGRS